MRLQAKLISEGWIDLRTSKLSKLERSLGDWAEEALSQAVYNDADYALEIIEAIHACDPKHSTVEEFAAGPLEDLLAYQGAFVIDRIEVKARQDPSFAFVLGGVWQNMMPDAIWERVVKCRTRKGWDGVSA